MAKKTPPKTDLLSLRAAAKQLGVSVQAVSKAVQAGRLRASVVRDAKGVPKIADIAMAAREWAASTDHSRAPGYVKERARRADHAEGLEVPDDLNLAEESAREKFWKARLAELDYRERSGELVDARAMAARLANAFVMIRTKLLAIPTRAKLQLPHLSLGDIGTLDGLVREALEDLAAAAVTPGEEAPDA